MGYMFSIRSIRSVLKNWTSSTKYHIAYHFLRTTSGTLMTCSKRSGNTLLLSEFTPNPKDNFQTTQLRWCYNKERQQSKTSAITFTRVSCRTSDVHLCGELQ